MGGLSSKLRQIAAMNISQAISSTRLEAQVSTSVENCIHDTNYLYSQMKIFINSRSHMIQYSFYWKMTLKEIRYKFLSPVITSVQFQLLLCTPNLPSLCCHQCYVSVLPRAETSLRLQLILLGERSAADPDLCCRGWNWFLENNERLLCRETMGGTQKTEASTKLRFVN